jgi:hypothetical protein
VSGTTPIGLPQKNNLFNYPKEVKMNIKRIALALVLGLLILLTACNEATVLGAENDFRRKQFGWGTHADIIFEPGDKCTLEIHEGYMIDEGSLRILVKDNKYDNYMIAVSTLDEGYTLEDLKAYQPANASPSFTKLIAYYILDPDSATGIADFITIDEGELYFTCQVQGPDAWKNIDSLGPLSISGK